MHPTCDRSGGHHARPSQNYRESLYRTQNSTPPEAKRVSLLDTFPDGERGTRPFLGLKLGRPFLTGRAVAYLVSVSVDFVNAQYWLVLLRLQTSDVDLHR